MTFSDSEMAFAARSNQTPFPLPSPLFYEHDGAKSVSRDNYHYQNRNHGHVNNHKRLGQGESRRRSSPLGPARVTSNTSQHDAGVRTDYASRYSVPSVVDILEVVTAHKSSTSVGGGIHQQNGFMDSGLGLDPFVVQQTAQDPCYGYGRRVSTEEVIDNNHESIPFNNKPLGISIMPGSLSVVPPEVLLQRMSPEEKDQLLRQFLSQPRQVLGSMLPVPGQQRGEESMSMPGAYRQHHSGRARRSRKKYKTPKESLSPQEVEMLDVQTGILMSLKEAEKPRPKPPSNVNVDDEALEFGRRASRDEFRELCRLEDKRKETEQVLLEKAKLESLDECHATPRFMPENDQRLLIDHVKKESLTSSNASQNHVVVAMVNKVEDDLLEEAKRTSLTSSATSMSLEDDRLMEEAKRESLALPPPVSKENRLIEEVKRASLLENNEGVVAHQAGPSSSLFLAGAGQQVPPNTLLLLNANRKSSLSAMTSPFEDGGEMMMENRNTRIPIPPSLPIRAPSTCSSDRKPPALPDGAAQSNSHYDACANMPRQILPGSFPVGDIIPLGGHFGTMHDVGLNLPQQFRSEDDSSLEE